MERHKRFGHNKQGNVERRTYEERERTDELAWKGSPRESTRYRWEQGALRHPGATRAYIAKKYGSKGFNEDGTIKENALNNAIRNAKQRHDTLWEKRLVLARTFKEQRD